MALIRTKHLLDIIKSGEKSKLPSKDPTYFFGEDIRKLLEEGGVNSVEIIEGNYSPMSGDSEGPITEFTNKDINNPEIKTLGEETYPLTLLIAKNKIGTLLEKAAVGITSLDHPQKIFTIPGAMVKKGKQIFDTNSLSRVMNDPTQYRPEKQDQQDKLNEYLPILQNLQANIIRAHRKKNALFAFVRFGKDQQKEVIDWMQDKLKLTTALNQIKSKDGIDEIRCCYLTNGGYDYLKIPDHLKPRIGSMAFKNGLYDRTIFKKSSPYLDENYKKEVHALILVAHNDEQTIEGWKKALAEDFKNLTGEDESAFWFFESGRFSVDNSDSSPREWFGFLDGTNSASFFSETRESNNAPLKLVLVPDMNGGQPDCFGSFLAFLKFKQNVLNFQNTINKLSKNLGVDENQAGTLLIGKDKNGVLLDDNNAAGLVCPIHSHVAKVKSKDKPGEPGGIVRRSMIYGPPKDAEGNEERGILFMSFQSDLEWQFEDLVNRNMYGYDPFNPDDGPDPFISEGLLYNRKYAKKIDKKRTEISDLQIAEELVTFRGGGYFFAPSISFFANLK